MHGLSFRNKFAVLDVVSESPFGLVLATDVCVSGPPSVLRFMISVLDTALMAWAWAAAVFHSILVSRSNSAQGM
jgi:hypothetical protein